MVDKLLLEPAQEGYSVGADSNVISVTLDGGASRSRLDKRHGSVITSVTWYCLGSEYQYLRTFYRTKANYGATAILIDIINESGGIEEYTVKIVPNTLTLQSKNGNAYIVGAQLEVFAKAEDLEFDDMFMELYELYGAETGAFFNALEKLANYDLPE